MKYSETKRSDINVAMAGVLRGERKRAMLSMEDLCRLTGITDSTLKRIFNGSTDISVADLALIATALNRARPDRSRRTPSWLLEQAEHDIGRWAFSLSDEPESPDGGLFADVVEQMDLDKERARRAASEDPQREAAHSVSGQLEQRLRMTAAEAAEEFDREVRKNGAEDMEGYAEFRAQFSDLGEPVRKAATSDPELDADEPDTP